MICPSCVNITSPGKAFVLGRRGGVGVRRSPCLEAAKWTERLAAVTAYHPSKAATAAKNCHTNIPARITSHSSCIDVHARGPLRAGCNSGGLTRGRAGKEPQAKEGASTLNLRYRPTAITTPRSKNGRTQPRPGRPPTKPPRTKAPAPLPHTGGRRFTRSASPPRPCGAGYKKAG